MRYGSVVLMLAAIACSGDTKDDADGDGFGVDQDCDDKNKDINPQAEELCNEIDDNCNDQIDEYASIVQYPDTDGDGFGDSAGPQDICVGTAGFVTANGDCDDTDPNVNPDAVETCADVDSDCDGDAYSGATDFPTFYADVDGDTFGSEDIKTASTCLAPAGYVAVSGDCDDDHATTNPDADEVCDGLDNDCDDTPDDNVPGAATLYTDADGDGFGRAGSGAPQCAGPGLVDNDDDCDDTDPLARPGNWYADVDGDGFGDEADFLIACQAPGGRVADAGDCDDGDAAANPDGVETCASGDQDCDGEVDEDPADGTPWYDDNDLDGYGDPRTRLLACSPPGGDYVVNGSDCNDGSTVSFPGADELCDGIDNDCDLTADNDVVGAPTWYVDADGDLFGDPTTGVAACVQPPGSSASAGDCDDQDPTAFPGNPELCDGGVDNDCDVGTDEANTALNYRDADGDGFGTDQDTVVGCSPPPGYVQVSGDCDDTDASVNPVTSPNCTFEHCGAITTSTTWSNRVTHRITCDVQVEGPARPTLTIEPGARIEFTPATELAVGRNGDGRILINGQPAVPVVLTSTNAVKAPGQWDGLYIGPRDTGSRIVNADVSAAGGAPLAYPGGVVLSGSDAVVDGLYSHDNLGGGLVVEAGGEPLVTNSRLEDNTGNGLYVAVGGGLSRLATDGSQDPSFENNVITGNGDRPVTIPGSHADEIDLSNVLSPNATEEIQLLAGVLRFTGSWYDHRLPYVVADNAIVEVSDGPAAQLTIEDNVEVYFGSGSGLSVGTTAGGTLFTGLNTLFTGTDFVLANSLNWSGLILGQFDLGSVVSDLEIAYGGGNGLGNIVVVDSAPSILDVFCHDSDNNGIYVSGGGAAPWIADSIIVNNDTNGVFVESISGVARDISGPTFEGNLLTGNGGSPVVFPPNFIGELSDTTQFNGNGARIGIHGGVVFDTADWLKLDEDYEVLGDIGIGGPRDPIVTVQPGTNIFFQNNAGLQAGVNDDGVLVLAGQPNAHVMLTSADPVPGKGDWDGLTLGGQLTPGVPEHNFAYTDFWYGGGPGGQGGTIVVLNGRDPVDPTCGLPAALSLEEVEVNASSLAALKTVPDTTVLIDGFATDGQEDIAFAFSALCDTRVTPLHPPDLNLDLGGLSGCFPAVDMQYLLGEQLNDPISICDFTIRRDSWLPVLDQPYRLDHDVNVSFGTSPELLIDPGVVVYVDPGEQIALQCGTSGQGYLYADQVLFTSGASTPADGDWEGIQFGGACATRMYDSTVEYAGADGSGAIHNFGCCGQDPAFGVLQFGSYLSGMHVSDSSSCAFYSTSPIYPNDPLFPLPRPNTDPAVLWDGVSDFPVANGLLPDFNSTFSGSLGGFGEHCAIPQ